MLPRRGLGAHASSGVSERTIHRWLDNPAFALAYRHARRKVFAHATAARVSSACAVLEFGRESIELDDLAARLEAVEQAQARQKKR